MMPFSPQPFFPTRIFAQLAQAILSTVAMLTAPYSTASTMHPNHPLYWKVGSAGSAQKRATLPPWKDPTQWKPSVPNTDPMANTPMFGQNQDGSIRPGYKLAIVPDPAHVPDQALGGAANTAGVKKDKKKKGNGKGNKNKDKGKGKGGKDKRKGDTKDGDKGKDGKRQKGDGKIAVPPIAPGATPSPPIQPILSGDLPKVEIPQTEQQKKGADAQWVRDALCFASAEANPCLSRKATKRVKFAARELHRTAPILLSSHEAVKACIVAAMEKEMQKAAREMERLKAKALVAAQLAATDGAPPTNAGLETTMAVGAEALGETKSEEEVEASDCSHGKSESESSNDSDDAEMKPAHAVVVPIPTDGKFWICEIPLTDLENQNAIRMVSSILTELTERTATRASYVSGLCIAQSVVFGAVPLQLTKTNYEEESAKKVANSVIGSNAVEPVGLAASSTMATPDTADMAVDTKEEVAKGA